MSAFHQLRANDRKAKATVRFPLLSDISRGSAFDPLQTLAPPSCLRRAPRGRNAHIGTVGREHVSKVSDPDKSKAWRRWWLIAAPFWLLSMWAAYRFGFVPIAALGGLIFGRSAALSAPHQQAGVAVDPVGSSRFQGMTAFHPRRTLAECPLSTPFADTVSIVPPCTFGRSVGNEHRKVR